VSALRCPAPGRIRRLCKKLSQRVDLGLEESADAVLHAAQDLHHVVIGQGGKRHEPDDALFTDPNAVGDHAMEVNVQVERAAEPLHERDRAGSGATNAQPARA
jgi:hypothetical protein